MKKFLILLIFVSGYCYSQEPVFNFENDKACKITMKGADTYNKADHIERLMEKMMLSLFSYVDTTNSTGYFIVDNFYKVHEIEKLLNNESEMNFIGSEEIQLTEDFFLEIYMKRGRFKPDEFSSYPPKKIIMGPFNKLTDGLYNKASEIWKKKYTIKQ